MADPPTVGRFDRDAGPDTRVDGVHRPIPRLRLTCRVSSTPTTRSVTAVTIGQREIMQNHIRVQGGLELECLRRGSRPVVGNLPRVSASANGSAIDEVAR